MKFESRCSPDVRQTRSASGELGDVEVLGEGLLVDLVGVEPAGGDLAGDRPGGVGELGAAAVVDAHRQRQHVVVAGQLLGDLELLDHRPPQPRGPAGPADPDAELVHLVAAAADHVAVEAHQEPHLVGRARPVLGGEGVRRDRLHADLDGALDHVEQRVLAAARGRPCAAARAAWPSGRCRPSRSRRAAAPGAGGIAGGRAPEGCGVGGRTSRRALLRATDRDSCSTVRSDAAGAAGRDP